jgi:hypothetical protein
MIRIRHFLLLIAAVIVVVLLHSPAEAFWGFGSGRDGAGSGLDLVQGYDRNTVTTLTGRVAVIPDSTADPVTVEINTGTQRLVVVLGPRWYLQDDNLDWKVGDSITVRGSRAQGQDGRTYLLAQWVSGISGGQLVLRNDAGRPGWSGGSRGAQQTVGGQMQRGGGTGGTGTGTGTRRGR